MDINKSTIARFWAKVDKSSDCWKWLAGGNSGYGSFWLNNKQQRAHRVSWTIHNGPIPDGLCVLHYCDNPPCVNPAHLFLGSTIENNIDRDNKGRTARQKGELHGGVKLTEIEVVEIRHRYIVGGITQQELGDKYGVTRPNIGYIVNRKSWSHI